MGVLISLAVGVVGITFGVLADAGGLSLAQSMTMSVLVFTGASQFAAVSVITAGGSVAAALGTAVLLAARNVLYGPIVAQWLDGPLLRRAGLAHFIIDESAGVGAAQTSVRASRTGFLVTGIGVFVAWNTGTLIGVLSGDLIGDPTRYGLDVAFPASFLALLAPHLRTTPGRVTAGVGALVVVATVSFLPVGVPILLASLAVVPGMMIASSGGGGGGFGRFGGSARTGGDAERELADNEGVSGENPAGIPADGEGLS